MRQNLSCGHCVACEKFRFYSWLVADSAVDGVLGSAFVTTETARAGGY